jgi:glucosamine--fructose-6-phosphate aminotransferase (isomerizing)
MNSPLVDPACTRMFREAAQAAAVARAQLERNRMPMGKLGAALRAAAPRAVVTCARGSSDHAATYAKYLLETRARVLTASAAPSVASVYGVSHDLRDCAFIAISQSGHSPDILATAESAKKAGALVIALVNDESSPLASLATEVVPLCAGEEKSVAATKSYLASLVALMHLVSEWTEDEELLRLLPAIPAQLERSWELDWGVALARLRDASNLFVIARGVGLGIAQEAALKCKETCGIHAESFSSAEVRHGPQALLGAGFPALVFAQDDETLEGTMDLARDLSARGVDVMVAGARVKGAIELPSVRAAAPAQPILLAQSFYRLANALAIARGLDPDSPPHLRKVTRTT